MLITYPFTMFFSAKRMICSNGRPSMSTPLRATLISAWYTYLSVREDAMDLYGFFSQEERKLFQQLIAVSGVGPKAALAIFRRSR